MKKLVMLFLLTGLNLISGNARSQENQEQKTEIPQEYSSKRIQVSGGIKLESNYSNFLHSRISGGKSMMKPGVTAGGFLNLGILKHFSIQPELLFHYKESDFDQHDRKGIYRYWGIEVPIYAMYHWDLKRGHHLHAGIGPYTEFGLNATLKRDGKKTDLYEKNAENEMSAMQDSNSGFGIITGYDFPFGLQINISYKISISNLLDAHKGSSILRPQTFSLGLAYCFGK